MRDLRERRRITQWIDELRDELTALSLPEGRILVTSSVCVHMGGEFDVDWDHRQMRCRWHDWCYDLDSGHCVTFALPGRHLRHYAHVIEGDDLYVLLTP